MPKIVSSYLAQGSFEGTLQMQRQLILDYESNARKYAEGNVGTDDRICSFPHYCLFLLRRFMKEQTIFG